MAGLEPLLVYFHGVPGAPIEVTWLEHHAKTHGLKVFAPDRFVLSGGLDGDAYFQSLAAGIVAAADDRPVHFIAFSLGAFVALQTSRFMADQVRSIHLVSAAAPLDGGDFLDALAGKQVFRLARKAPLLFVLLSRWQGILARYAPAFLFRMLFASARGGDVDLAKDVIFQHTIRSAMQSAFLSGQRGYQREVLAYVQPWATTLPAIQSPVHLWQGEADNWSTPAMAHFLHETLAGAVSLKLLPGQSHYSCLMLALPQICARIGHDSGTP